MEPNDESLEWYHVSICRGMKTNWFYDDYEADPLFAKVMDGICASCPVRALCLAEGMDNQEYGLWGGVFLNNGKVDATRNAHKSDEDWEELRGALSG